jgi:hypothetical protein
MSRTTWGTLAFKIPFDPALTDEQNTVRQKQAVNDMIDIVEGIGGDLCTIKEVFDNQIAAKSGERDYIEGGSTESFRRK